MTEPSNIVALIFGEHDFEPSACAPCGGVGLTGICNDEMPALCAECGGSGLAGPIFDPAFVAQYRKPLTDAELDEAAAEFGAALLDGLIDIERQLEAGVLPLASVSRPEVG